MKKLTKDMVGGLDFTLSTPSCIESIKNLIEGDSMKIDDNVYLTSIGANLQRDYVWTLEMKRHFILSLLRGFHILPLSVNVKCDEDLYEIIDGKQRLNALMSFCRSEYSIIVNDEEFYIDDFELYLGLRLRLYNFNAYQHMEHKRDKSTILSDSDKIKWFLMVNNTGVRQQDDYLQSLQFILSNR